MKNLSSHGGQASASARAQRAEAHRQAGLHAQRARRWDAAAQEFERATELTPADALMWMNLSRSRMQLGLHVQALDAARFRTRSRQSGRLPHGRGAAIADGPPRRRIADAGGAVARGGARPRLP